MKYTWRFLPLFLLVVVPVASAGSSPLPTPPESWTAKQAVAFALGNNPENAVARRRIDQANALSTMVKSTDYPLVDLRTEYSQTNNPMYSFGNILNQGAFDDSIDFNDPGTTDNLLLKAEIQYRFYNGGRDSADKLRASARIDISETDLTATHNTLGFEVVKSFQTILQSEKMVEVRREALGAITASMKVGKARYEAGDLLRQDLLNLELQQARASENLINSKHNLELAKRGFLNLLGLKERTVNIDETLDSTQEPPTDLNFSKRHELRRLSAIEKEAAADLEKAKAGMRPTVDGFAGYQWDKGWELNEDGDSWMTGIRMNYTLFDGHRTSSDIAVSKSRLKEIAALRRKTELALSLEIEQARLSYRQAEERIGVTEKMVDVAGEMARLSRARFKEGVILASDLIDFEMRLTDARARNLAARAEYQVAIANLIRATGNEQFSDHQQE